jgi:leader peptidase (prepilin peptidase)/N-methyltransferase
MHSAVELGFIAVALCMTAAEPDLVSAWLGCALGWTLLVLAWIDWQHMLLPDVLTLPLVWAGLLATLILDPASASDHAAAALLGYAAFRVIELAYRRLRGRDGLGQGDAKLMAAAGAWLGLAPLSSVMVTAAALGLMTAAWPRVRRRRVDEGAAIPFGPALCVAIWVVWLGLDPLAWLIVAA